MKLKPTKWISISLAFRRSEYAMGLLRGGDPFGCDDVIMIGTRPRHDDLPGEWMQLIF